MFSGLSFFVALFFNCSFLLLVVFPPAELRFVPFFSPASVLLFKRRPRIEAHTKDVVEEEVPVDGLAVAEEDGRRRGRQGGLGGAWRVAEESSTDESYQVASTQVRFRSSFGKPLAFRREAKTKA